MGACLSSAQPEDVQARQRTQEIDKRLEEDYRRLRKEVKILLLGKKKTMPTVSLTLVQVQENPASRLYIPPILVASWKYIDVLDCETDENFTSRWIQSY